MIIKTLHEARVRYDQLQSAAELLPELTDDDIVELKSLAQFFKLFDSRTNSFNLNNHKVLKQVKLTSFPQQVELGEYVTE